MNRGLFSFERLKFTIASGRSRNAAPPLREDEPDGNGDEEPAGRGNRPNESTPPDPEGEHNRM